MLAQKRNRFARFGWIALLGTLAQPLAAQQAGELRGLVKDQDNAPVTAVTVVVERSRSAAQTGQDGRFVLRGLPAGTYQLRTARIGYQPAAVSVEVPAGGATDVVIVVQRASIELRGVTVIGTREELGETRAQLRLVPGGVSLVEPEQIRATRQANFHDVLRLTPGVFVQPRFGAADESQLSIRGSGLRNNFHLRGVNLLVNGMAYRNADGFTDFESLELLTAEAIQVYKGGNALRYGGSTLGGAINIETKTGYTASPLNAFAEGGANGFFKGQLASGGTRGGFDYYASYARTSLDGYREWSDQRRDRVNAHVGYVLSPRLDARAFYFFARVREHLPGALTRAQFDSAPRQAVANNVSNRWGRDYDLHHLGIQLRSQLAPRQQFEIAPYFQYRDIDHPIFRVIAQVSRDVGAELRYENTNPLAGREHRFTLGLQPASENLDNRQYTNVAGQHGALAKDQKEKVKGVALYLEDVLAITSRFSAVLGVRYDNSTRSARDHFLSDGDQSDSRTFRALMPKVGALYRLASGELFANASRSFEPPLLLELNSLTVPGFVDLHGQDAWQFEIGGRGRSGPFSWDVAAYDIELQDEILNINVPPFPGAPFTVPTYRNADRTRHLGLEAGIGLALDPVSLRVAFTTARFTFRRDSSFAGNDLPGAPRHMLQADLSWRHNSGLSVTPTFEWVPTSYYLNSANTVKNDAWASLGLRVEWLAPRMGLTAFAAVQNLTDARYSGSTQVDNGAWQFFEPADGRSVYAGFRWQR
jgi:iron complex outermembrane receptor protein